MAHLVVVTANGSPGVVINLDLVARIMPDAAGNSMVVFANGDKVTVERVQPSAVAQLKPLNPAKGL